MSETNASAKDIAGKYLTFNLGTEQYGVGILKVQEIIQYMEVTPIPRTPDFFKGVINLRGRVIPVIDLRIKFGFEEIDVTERTCIIVVQVNKGDGHITMGLIVDEVSEVLDVAEDDIESASGIIDANVDDAFILGLAKTETAVKILLDIDRVLSRSEVAMVSRHG